MTNTESYWEVFRKSVMEDWCDENNVVTWKIAGAVTEEGIKAAFDAAFASQRAELMGRIEGLAKVNETGCKCNDFECAEKCDYSWNNALKAVLALLVPESDQNHGDCCLNENNHVSPRDCISINVPESNSTEHE